MGSNQTKGMIMIMIMTEVYMDRSVHGQKCTGTEVYMDRSVHGQMPRCWYIGPYGVHMGCIKTWMDVLYWVFPRTGFLTK